MNHVIYISEYRKYRKTYKIPKTDIKKLKFWRNCYLDLHSVHRLKKRIKLIDMLDVINSKSPL